MERVILEALNSYLRGDTTLAEFRDGLSELTWENPSASPLAHEIEFVIDEAAGGAITLPVLRDELTAIYNAALATA